MIGANTFKAIIKAHTGLTRLSLSGKKLSAMVISDICKSPNHLHLTHVAIGMTASLNKVKPEAFLDIFSACPALESVSLFLALDRTSWVLSARDRVAAARGDRGPSLLRSIAFEMEDGAGFDWRTGIALGPLSQLGAAFPALEARSRSRELRCLRVGLRRKPVCASA